MASTTQIKVLLVDDHQIVREGLQQLLEMTGDYQVVGQAGDGHEALAAAKELTPDVIVMDVLMPNMDGVQACREILEQLPDTRVLILTASNQDEAVIDAVAAGAAGYLQKFSGRDEFLSALREVADGRSRIPLNVVKRAFDSIRNAPATPAKPQSVTLTAREEEILTHFARGNSYAQVAKIAGNSPITIRNSIYRIQDKLGVKTKQEIVVWAVRNGLLDAPAGC